jgi:hypothetical protein
MHIPRAVVGVSDRESVMESDGSSTPSHRERTKKESYALRSSNQWPWKQILGITMVRS